MVETSQIDNIFSTEIEYWRDIPGYPGYKASNFGRIRSIGIKARILVPINLQGYHRVKVTGSKAMLVHRLVAITFIDNPESKPHINHKDGNKQNNHVTNLEWCTISENIKHSFQIGLRVPPNNIGTNHSQAKLTEQDIRDIRDYINNGMTQKSVANKYGVTHTNISAIVTGRSWKHVK